MHGCDSSPTSPTAPIAPMGDKAMGLLSHEVERDAAHDLWKAATSPNSQISPKEDSPVTSTTSNDSPTSRWLKMGLVTLASGLMIGATGGLAAPYIAPSLATLFASMGLTIGVTTTGVGALFGVVGGGLTAYTLAQDSGIKEFRFHPVITQPKNSPALHVIVAVSGWGADISDLYDPWSIVPVFAPFSEVTAVICEPEIPVDLGRMLESHRDTHARRRSQPAEETQAEYIHQPTEPDPDFIEHTDLKPWRPHHDSAQSLSYSLHTAWLLALETAPKAGRHLAYILASKTHGSRPVTLIGTSIGALTIFECLVELGHRRAVGIVDSVFLLGAPIDASSTNAYKWCLARTVVAGRFVVGYSMKDKELRALMAQPEDANEDTGVQAGVDVTDVAGLGPVLIELRTVLPTDLSPDDRDFLEEDDDEAEPGRQQAEVSSTSTSDPFVSSFVGQELKPPQDITRPDSATFSDILLSPSIPTAKEPSTAFEPTHSSLPWPPLHRTLPLENVDLSRIIHYHIDYRDRIHAVLNAVGFERARPSEGGAGEERERGQEEAREEREVGEVLWDAGAE
ncbi:uncharacterized protein EV422DRAFT_225337 [Fimicolochytrium jonesii]|uniref:uncharacterized protein n=1 Tax=Fimicolochytrium jonesii TaxID=1396493 RepID=UPI0022FE290C|nr:uncharacterized protein EV422DRAFT_225337 [Fimicolochytrium jonesii]KAI8817449.1 hypothetical protein EV422DRAFT_225337 [Fimicolochytrium jonesii]